MALNNYETSIPRTLQTPSQKAILRLKRDLRVYWDTRPAGIHLEPDENNIMQVHSLLIGGAGTPYEGGNFYFVATVPKEYPFRAPRVTLLTTGEKTVIFNSNITKTGEVCLGYRGNPGNESYVFWTPAQTITGAFQSIQSLMNEKPYYNESIYYYEQDPYFSELYNKVIVHETIRVAVCDMLEGNTRDSKNCPDSLRSVMEKEFVKHYDYFVATCERNLHLEKVAMVDPHGNSRGMYDYPSILDRLKAIRGNLVTKGLFELPATP